MCPGGLTFVQRAQMVVAAQRHQRKEADHRGGDHVVGGNVDITGLFDETGDNQPAEPENTALDSE